MHDRSLLGPADVDDHTLAGMVARLYDVDPQRLRILESTAAEFAYDLPAITTGGRYVVRGTWEADGDVAPYALFVKVVHAFSRSILFESVPEHLREIADASVPWRTEPLAYRSDLADRLPAGLTMPPTLAVVDLDDTSSAIWLPLLDVVATVWDEARYEWAAYLLGRMSGSPRVAELGCLGPRLFRLSDYADGRLAHQVIPTLLDDEIWRHPLVAGAFGDGLRDRLRAAAAEVPAYVEEVMSLPQLPAHGDACPNNLLSTAGSDDITLIDYGFWMPMPAGADLGQLLIGEVQLGRDRAGDLAARDDALVAAYVRGLRDEGCEIPESVVRRAHALHLLLMSGLSALPVELLDQPPSPELEALVADRAAIARFCLDRVEQG